MRRHFLVMLGIVVVGASIWFMVESQGIASRQKDIDDEYNRGLKLKDELVGERIADISSFRGTTLSAGVSSPAQPPTSLAESSIPIDRSTPLALLRGISAAVERGDRAWLARVLARNRGALALNSLHGSQAEANFLVGDARSRWNALARGIRDGTLVIDAQEDWAVASVAPADEDGGVSVELSQFGGEWYVAE